MLIPARQEEFLRQTVLDVLKNRRADTEVVVGLDGAWAEPRLDQDERLNVVYVPESVGQRAITNLCARLARGRYLIKVDAHCALDEGFDRKMLDAFASLGDKARGTVMAPLMRNLHVFNWKCPKCGFQVYQDKEPICRVYDRHPGQDVRMRKKLLWIAKPNPESYAYCFDPEPHFQYHGEQKRRIQQAGDMLGESMSLQGSAFMCSADDYWRLEVCGEEFGSWGSQGIEVACKFWLSGGQVLVNRATWYAHCFRTKPNFGFPYKLSGRQVDHAKQHARELFFEGAWPGMVRPVSWLVERFWPVPGWTEADLAALRAREGA